MPAARRAGPSDSPPKPHDGDLVTSPLRRMTSRRTRVLMTTEGTYPYNHGGVSTWCSGLVNGLADVAWQVLPIMAGAARHRAALCPPEVELLPCIEIWSGPPGGWRLTRPPREGATLPGELAAGLLAWNGDHEALIDSLVWCRRHADRVRSAFRSHSGWESFVAALGSILAERPAGVAAAPEIALADVSMLYHALYWVATTAAAPTPRTDLLLATAAGWSGIPALVHKALHGTPILLVEHGVYVREAYLSATNADPGHRFATTRLARGLARAAYASADLINPVQEANSGWELALGVPPQRLRTVSNGMASHAEPTPPPRIGRVVSIGRLDPLKDIHTLLRVAEEVVRLVPEAHFIHYGPYRRPEDTTYGRSCQALFERLELGTRFRFHGFVGDINAAIAEADVIAMTSISEGFPMSILEAMAQARPVVASSVGGIPGVLRGCGYIAPPGDVHGLATGIATLLQNPGLSAALGQRGRRRLERKYGEAGILAEYRSLFAELTGPMAAA